MRTLSCIHRNETDFPADVGQQHMVHGCEIVCVQGSHLFSPKTNLQLLEDVAAAATAPTNEAGVGWTEMFNSRVGNPCPTVSQLLASWILYTLLVAEC